MPSRPVAQQLDTQYRSCNLCEIVSCLVLVAQSPKQPLESVSTTTFSEYALMEDWLERVIQERKELNAKLAKLAAFISRRDPRFEALSEEDKRLLRRQREAMLEYSEILEERITSARQ